MFSQSDSMLGMFSQFDSTLTMFNQSDSTLGTSSQSDSTLGMKRNDVYFTCNLKNHILVKATNQILL